MRTAITIEGMTCDHCVRGVDRALKGLPGVRVEQVGIGKAVVDVDPAQVTPEQIFAAVEDEGYTVTGTESLQ